MERATDQALWQQFCQGNAEAFGGLYRLYYSDLLWFGVQYVGDMELVRDEINQEFLHLWDKKETLTDVAHVRNYLLTTLRNRLVDALRKAGRDVKGMDADHASPSCEEELVDLEDREQLVKAVKRAIDGLPPRQRELVFLRYYQGLGTEEIVTKTGLTPRTIYNTLHTALQKLREALGPSQSKHLDRLLSLLLLVY